MKFQRVGYEFGDLSYKIVNIGGLNQEDRHDLIDKEIYGFHSIDSDNLYLVYMKHHTKLTGESFVHENRLPYYVCGLYYQIIEINTHLF